MNRCNMRWQGVIVMGQGLRQKVNYGLLEVTASVAQLTVATHRRRPALASSSVFKGTIRCFYELSHFVDVSS